MYSVPSRRAGGALYLHKAQETRLYFSYDKDLEIRLCSYTATNGVFLGFFYPPPTLTFSKPNCQSSSFNILSFWHPTLGSLENHPHFSIFSFLESPQPFHKFCCLHPPVSDDIFFNRRIPRRNKGNLIYKTVRGTLAPSKKCQKQSFDYNSCFNFGFMS